MGEGASVSAIVGEGTGDGSGGGEERKTCEGAEGGAGGEGGPRTEEREERDREGGIKVLRLRFDCTEEGDSESAGGIEGECNEEWDNLDEDSQIIFDFDLPEMDWGCGGDDDDDDDDDVEYE